MINLMQLTLLLSLVVPSLATAIPLPKGPRALIQVPATMSADFNFEGILTLSNCSGSLIALEGAADSEQALVLTNGHCLESGMPAPGEVVTRRPSSRSFKVLDADARIIGRVSAEQIVYSTMTGTDMTIYRLRQTYAQIQERFNVRPFVLASAHPSKGTNIEVVSGYWKRGYRCGIDMFVHRLDEGGYSMMDSIRYTNPGCEVIGGTSGSPIIQAGTRTVIGVNNTGNEDGERCTMNNPCEIDANGTVSFKKGLSYGQQTYLLYGCLNERRELDLARPGCQLPH